LAYGRFEIKMKVRVTLSATIDDVACKNVMREQIS